MTVWHEWSCSMMHCWWPVSGGGSGVSAADLKCGTRGFMPAATHLTLALGPAPSCIMSVEITGDPALTAMSASPLHVCFRLNAPPKNGKIFENFKITKLSFVIITWSQPQSRNVAVAKYNYSSGSSVLLICRSRTRSSK